MTESFPTAIPEMPVKDMKQAAAYYQSHLGFTLDWGGEELGLAGLSKGSCRIFLADEDYREHYGNAGPTLIWMNLASEQEVTDLHQAWTASGALVQSNPEPKPWGLFEFTATDLDGNLFRAFYDFATPRVESDGTTGQ
jgi:uncharacterized glyoxalase superfamily protein PhnB